MDRDWITGLQEAFDRLIAEEGDKAGSEVLEAGAPRLSDLINKKAVFDGFYTNPKALAGVYHVLKAEFKVFAMNGPEPLRGAPDFRSGTRTGTKRFLMLRKKISGQVIIDSKETLFMWPFRFGCWMTLTKTTNRLASDRAPPLACASI